MLGHYRISRFGFRIFVTTESVMTLICRLLPHMIADGPRNMAADETLLESAVKGTASLRFYGWSEPALSLGYFQPDQARRQDSILAQLPFVRRPSGGKALVHHHELTYALALPAGSPWQTGETRGVKWIRRMHTILAAALDTLGVAACFPPPQSNRPVPSLQPLSPAAGERGRSGTRRPAQATVPQPLSPVAGRGRGEGAGRFLCFECISPDDLVTGFQAPDSRLPAARNAASAARCCSTAPFCWLPVPTRPTWQASTN